MSTDSTKQVKIDDDYEALNESKYDEQGRYIFAGRYGRGNVNGKWFNSKLDKMCKDIDIAKLKVRGK